MRVEDAHGQPPSIPFWFGEAPGRSVELSRAVSRLRADVDARVEDREATIEWVAGELGLSEMAAYQIVEYLAETKRLLGVVPTMDKLVAERFFDEAGGMQLVLHTPFGSRINRAWGLALRKRFCRQFNFELQAAATEDALVLSLGPQHSFPLEDVFRYLHPNTTENILVQALLDAPMFQTRWRWGSTIALAILRRRGGQKTPPQIQRMEAEDLLAAVFPDAAACLENIAGDREIPDHPLVRQTIHDCLHDAMDLEGLLEILARIHAGGIEFVGRDTPEPSPLSHETLNARPYAFLDDAPLEERRTQAVYTRRAFEPSSAGDMGVLDVSAIQRVRDEAWPTAGNADELHDALLMAGVLTEDEVRRVVAGEAAKAEEAEGSDSIADQLVRARRVGQVWVAPEQTLWFAVERIDAIRAVYPEAAIEPHDLTAPVSAGPSAQSSAAVATDREAAIRDLLRGRLEIVGPSTAAALAGDVGVPVSDVDIALVALEGEGVVLRGAFTPVDASHDDRSLEWCDRRLLARIHRYTLNRLRAEIEPVSTADFMRFLFAWQHVDAEHHVMGVEGLAAIVAQLDGYDLAAGAWEPDVLSRRCEEYDPLMLDTLCLTGRVAWGRVSPPAEPGSGPFVSGPLRSTPVALFMREHAQLWLHAGASSALSLSSNAAEVYQILERRGASFFHELVNEAGLLPTQIEQALGELVALGMVSADSFAGLRALLIPSSKRRPRAGVRRKHRTSPFGVESAGRWVVIRRKDERRDGGAVNAESDAIESIALVLLRRYGIVFRRLLTRESNVPPWRELLRVYRRLEARGEIRGGRFVAGMSGEQFARPEAVGQLRAIRRSEPAGDLYGISAADPLNLTGIVTPGDRVAALASNRVVYRDGVPVAAREGGAFREFTPIDPPMRHDVERALVRKRVSPALRAYLGNVG